MVHFTVAALFYELLIRTALLIPRMFKFRVLIMRSYHREFQVKNLTNLSCVLDVVCASTLFRPTYFKH